MQQRATKLILAGAALSVGIGAVSTLSAISSSDNSVSLSNAGKAAAVAELPTHAAATPLALKPKTIVPKILYSGHTLGSYFWDTGGSGNGDTGAPASGLPMQKGCFASPSWPMGTKGYVLYNGHRANFFICDRGPGAPSQDGVMLDIDGVTYAKLTGGTWNDPYVDGGSGQAGHIPVTYYVTHWGAGPGTGAPQPL